MNTIPQAAKILGVKESRLRYWDKEYSVVKARETATENRLITLEEMKTFTKIKLLFNFCNSEGIRQVLKGNIKVAVSDILIKNYE